MMDGQQRDFGAGTRRPGDQSARPANKMMTPDNERSLAELRKVVQRLREDVQVLTGERGAAGKPQAAVRVADLETVARGNAVRPISNPSSAVTSGPAGGAYGATEQAMLGELKAAVLELQANQVLIIAALREFLIVQRGSP